MSVVSKTRFEPCSGRCYWAEHDVIGPIAGVDEVGRGCLAGPVVAAAVILPPQFDRSGLHDSKQLSASKRMTLYGSLISQAIWALGAASSGEIDRVNILEASLLAMTRAMRRLKIKPALCLIDGPKAPNQLEIPVRTIIGGDHKCCAIAAASIVAKVARDRLMAKLDQRYSGYGFVNNVGYGTKQHRMALSSLGATVHHRRSFAPVAASISVPD